MRVIRNALIVSESVMALIPVDQSGFEEAIEKARSLVEEALTTNGEGLERLNEIEDFVYLKGTTGVVTWANQAYQAFYSRASKPHGRHAKTFLAPIVLTVAKHTDALILSGCERLYCDHIGVSGDGTKHLLRTYKQSLRHLQKSGYAILGVTRPLRPIATDEEDPEFEMARLASLFATFDDRDRELCRLFALGFNSSEIGEQLQMTSRNVDLRRKKCLELLGIDKVVDLARLLTRFEERGYLEINL
ncbi:helix-turn-helix transcriptional regulator [Botrimarina mediterranea]|uniref:HTH luxR-type domain-containing protein n=2 Tax=Botrimarina mediterranea TaxID=2528022 RepID=A0A518K408_9BACT|nr:sigma-70 family RNA polymerase sigma factor [Botrimarina mediterranea]QDV72497.1 hypothetical protein Spa11_06750 [Botrimarina mediterranea]QDV77069.1 hypothetical protein K2D_06560 [Planctomycetes bacterium K2D]